MGTDADLAVELCKVAGALRGHKVGLWPFARVAQRPSDNLLHLPEQKRKKKEKRKKSVCLGAIDGVVHLSIVQVDARPENREPGRHGQ